MFVGLRARKPTFFCFFVLMRIFVLGESKKAGRLATQNFFFSFFLGSCHCATLAAFVFIAAAVVAVAAAVVIVVIAAGACILAQRARACSPNYPKPLIVVLHERKANSATLNERRRLPRARVCIFATGGERAGARSILCVWV